MRGCGTTAPFGSPAHAGIDLSASITPWTHTRFPRTRGDRPLKAQHRRMAKWGSPAHAGIDPGDTSFRMRPLRFPRTRGDRPRSEETKGRQEEVPPHTRG